MEALRKCGWCGIYEVFSPLEEKPLMTELLEYGSIWQLVPEDVKILCICRYDCQRRRPMIKFFEHEKDDNWLCYLNPKYLAENEWKDFWNTPEGQRMMDDEDDGEIQL